MILRREFTHHWSCKLYIATTLRNWSSARNTNWHKNSSSQMPKGNRDIDVMLVYSCHLTVYRGLSMFRCFRFTFWYRSMRKKCIYIYLSESYGISFSNIFHLMLGHISIVIQIYFCTHPWTRVCAWVSDFSWQWNLDNHGIHRLLENAPYGLPVKHE